MGRRRKSNPLNLPPRVYAKHGAFYYHHPWPPPHGKWEHLGRDLDAVKRRAAEIKHGQGDGYDNRQARRRPLLVLELTAPLIAIARRRLHGFCDSFLGFIDKAH